MKILLIDNYDSFTYNLYHYISKLNCKVDVIRNDKIDSFVESIIDKQVEDEQFENCELTFKNILFTILINILNKIFNNIIKDKWVY